jgi:hypothetical protein
MNSNFPFFPAGEPLVVPALQATVFIVVAALLGIAAQRPVWKRALWQVCFGCLILLGLEQITGVGRQLYAQWETREHPASPNQPLQVLNPPAFHLLPGMHEIPLKPIPEIAESEPDDPALHTGFEKWASALGARLSLGAPAVFETPAAAPESAEPGRSPSGLEVLWFVGMLLVLGRILLARAGLFWLCNRAVRHRTGPIHARVQSMAARLRLRRSVRVFASGAVRSPMIFGVVRPTVILPERFAEAFGGEQQEVMLAHELAHLSARDPLWYLAADAASALFWWHPLVWWARARLHAASELAADEASVLVPRGPVTLAECLVVLAREWTVPRNSASIGVEGGGFRSRLGRRVERLLKMNERNWHRPSRWQLVSARGVAGMCGLGLVLAATGWATPAWVRSESSLAKSLGEGWRSLAALSFQPGEQSAESRFESAKSPLENEHGVRGSVTLIGDPPPEREILNVPDFVRAMREEPMRTRNFRVSAEGGLADVFVYIKGGLEGQKFEAPEEPVILEARGCEWEPYVAGVQTGQLVLFKNADPVLHNLQFSSPSRKNRAWNRALLANAKPAEARFEFPELFARLTGDFYPWMFAYLCIAEHPFFAVTDADGRFELPAGLPPGRYTLAAIHRRAGEIEREIVIGRDKMEEIQLQFELRNASSAEGQTITGKVVDAESGEPIERFTVTPGHVGTYDFLRWVHPGSREGEDGRYSIPREIGDLDPLRVNPAGGSVRFSVLKVEAPGYLPQMLRPDGNLWPDNVKLRKGDGHDGAIMEPDGHLAEGADVAFSLRFSSLNLQQGKLRLKMWDVDPIHHSPIVSTDDRGRFKLPGRAGALSIVATHEKGFREISMEEFAPEHPIRLHSWSRIEGKLMLGNAPVANETVYLRSKLPSTIYVNSQAKTDAEGRVTFEKVPPGDFNLYLQREKISPAALSVAPGETLRIDLDFGTTPGRRRLKTKLETIRLPEVRFDGVPLLDVLKQISEQAERHDPDGTGINFMVTTNINKATIHLAPPLRNLRLIDVLDAITKKSSEPIQFAIEEYAVVFSPEPPDVERLYSRVFRLDPRKFSEDLQRFAATNNLPSVSEMESASGRAGGVSRSRRAALSGDSEGTGIVHRTNSSLTIHDLVRQFFTNGGINFLAPGKSAFYNDRTGVLLVRGTLEEMLIIENLIREFQAAPAPPDSLKNEN